MKLNPIPWPVTLLERSVRIADWAEFEVPFMDDYEPENTLPDPDK